MNRRIKILFHIDELSAGGAEKVLCNLVNNMDQSQFEITVHTVYRGHDNYLKKGIIYKSVYEEKNRITHLLYRLEASLGIFYRMHLKGEYDVEVAYLECGPTKIIASSSNSKAKKIAWVHCDISLRAGDQVAEFIKKTKRLYQRYDRIVCVSDECRKSFLKVYGDMNNVEVVHNTIDENEILDKAAYDIPDDVPLKCRYTIMSCGRLSQEKNFLMLLKAFHKMLQKGIMADLWIIGDGNQKEILQKYIVENNLESYIKLLGYRENPYAILKQADLYVCSSTYEGFSTAVVEALILGLPVITTNCAGMHEILGESFYGLIVEKNEQALLTAMLFMYEDENLLHSYKNLAYKRGKELSGKQITQTTERLFKEWLI